MTATALPLDLTRPATTPVTCPLPACPRADRWAGEVWFAGDDVPHHPWAASLAHHPAARAYGIGIYQAILWVLTCHSTTHPGPSALPAVLALEARQQTDQTRGLTRRTFPWPTIALCLYCGAPIAYDGAAWTDRHQDTTCPAADAVDFDPRFGLINDHHHPLPTSQGGPTR